MSIVTPFCTPVMNGKEVQFFRSPAVPPDLPWVGYNGLLHAMGLSEEACAAVLRMTMNGPFAAELRVVATPAGPVTIAPHHIAQGLIDGLVEGGAAPAAFGQAYASAMIEALALLTGDLGTTAKIELLAATARRRGADYADR